MNTENQTTGGVPRISRILVANRSLKPAFQITSSVEVLPEQAAAVQGQVANVSEVSNPLRTFCNFRKEWRHPERPKRSEASEGCRVVMAVVMVVAVGMVVVSGFQRDCAGSRWFVRRMPLCILSSILIRTRQAGA